MDIPFVRQDTVFVEICETDKTRIKEICQEEEKLHRHQAFVLLGVYFFIIVLAVTILYLFCNFLLPTAIMASIVLSVILLLPIGRYLDCKFDRDTRRPLKQKLEDIYRQNGWDGKSPFFLK